MKFRIKFRHVEKLYYEAEIEANSKEEAEEIFDEEPFDHLVDEEPYETQGLTIEIIETKEIR